MARKGRRRRKSTRSVPTSYANVRRTDPQLAYTPSQFTRSLAKIDEKIFNKRIPRFVALTALKHVKRNSDSFFPKTYGAVPTAPLTNAETKVLGLCKSRKERKRVLFAKNKAGKTGQKSPKWTKLSKVRC